jgi:hypothetical protein
LCRAAHEPGGPQRCSGDARRNCERSQADLARLENRASELHAATTAPAATGAALPPLAETVLCKVCWQAAIHHERRTGLSRLKGYRRRHPDGARQQCPGITKW